MRLASAVALVFALSACSRSEPRSKRDHIELQMRCGDGDRSACDEVLRIDREGCGHRDAAACTLRGISVQVGKLEPQDLAAALGYFEKACALGDGAGCWYGGNCYRYGRGTPKDPAEALIRFQRACNKSYDTGCVDLGEALEHATPPDLAGAKAAYAKACSLGAKSACGR